MQLYDEFKILNEQFVSLIESNDFMKFISLQKNHKVLKEEILKIVFNLFDDLSQAYEAKEDGFQRDQLVEKFYVYKRLYDFLIEGYCTYVLHNIKLNAYKNIN